MLLEYRAAIDGCPGSANPILAALRNGRGDAAQFLARRGAALDLESAAGTGQTDTVQDILASRTAAEDERAAALAWACEFGHAGVARLLLDAGGDRNAMHEGNTMLRWAAIGAHPKSCACCWSVALLRKS